jgi:bifunctional pyridoxal-dependent enzyme with beta-cystathionase and maltose regulon repressor activities
MIAMQAIVDPGDRVVVVTPVWPNVAEIPRILGADVIRVGLALAPEGWTLDLDAFSQRSPLAFSWAQQTFMRLSKCVTAAKPSKSIRLPKTDGRKCPNRSRTGAG